MTATYIIRMDDISPYMNEVRFNDVLNLCRQYNIQPLLGVIPDNQDKQLRSSNILIDSFWSNLYHLYKDNHISLALHGHTHVYESTNSGILGINKYSEFAGLDYHTQYKKINTGLELLASYGFSDIDTFMAPAHSFDNTTLSVLKDKDFKFITDGFYLYPHHSKGLTFLPQQIANPRWMPCGCITICLHTDKMTSKEIDRLSKFIDNYHRHFIAFDDYKAQSSRYLKFPYAIANTIFHIIFKQLRKLKQSLR